MAGEWIPVDIAIGQKPEILELCEIADVGVEVAVYRVFSLWAWFSLNSADGAARATPSRLARVCGGDAEFWKAVESVGWLEFDDGEGTASIPGWEDRFSAGAKARASHAKNQRKYREKQQSDASVTVDSHKSDTASSPEERRGEEKRGENTHTHTHAEKVFSERGAGRASEEWEQFAECWNRTERARPWTAVTPPDGWADYASRPGWIQKASSAISKLPGCKFFDQPLAVTKFFEFVDRILAGEFDNAKSNGRQRRKPAGVRL